MLRRIIRRAVRHAYLLGAEQLVTPALVDATVEVMGGAYPELVKQHELVRERRQPRGGALPPDARARRRPARRRARHAATSPATTRSSCTTRSASRSTSRARSPRSAAARSTSTASTPRMAGAAHARQGGAQGRGRQGRRRAARALPRAARRARPHRLHRAPGVRDRSAPRCAALVGGRERLAAGGGRHRGRAWCSTARRSTPSPAARSATPARSRRRPARRVRVDDTQYGAARASCCTAGEVETGTIAEGDEVVAAIDGAAPRRASAATTPRPTCCTGRCARCSART